LQTNRQQKAIIFVASRRTPPFYPSTILPHSLVAITEKRPIF